MTESRFPYWYNRDSAFRNSAFQSRFGINRVSVINTHTVSCRDRSHGLMYAGSGAFQSRFGGDSEWWRREVGSGRARDGVRVRGRGSRGCRRDGGGQGFRLHRSESVSAVGGRAGGALSLHVRVLGRGRGRQGRQTRRETGARQRVRGSCRQTDSGCASPRN